MTTDGIVEDLADRIKRGQYPPGSKLPTYDQLADLYSVSAATIGFVVKRLKDRGLVVGRQGRGVFVAENIRPSGLSNPFAT
jgi:DNA-binding GntR family transcriptional regulator